MSNLKKAAHLGLGTAADANTGTSAGNVVVLDGSAKLPAVDGSALTNLPAGEGGSGTTLKETIASVAHGFVAGEVLHNLGAGWVKSQANAAANAEVVGVIESKTDDAFVIVLSGKITIAAAPFTAGVMFLSAATAGALTATDPTATGTVSKPVLQAISTSVGYVQIQRGFVNP